jgi:hypothetical protein
MSAALEELRQRIYSELCGRNAACRRAANYYIALLQNPCYPPQDKMTTRLKFFMQIVERYGRPPKCNIRALVEERLRGTMLEQYIDEIAELAERLRRMKYITSRVAAAAAATVVAEAHGIRVTRRSIAARFGTRVETMKLHMKDAVNIYLSRV